MTPGVLAQFEMLCAAARDGIRCPKNTPNGPAQAKALQQLVKAEMVRFEFYGAHCWRVAVILSGPDAGRTTAGDPAGGALMAVWDKTSRRLVGSRIGAGGTHLKYGLRDLRAEP